MQPYFFPYIGYFQLLNYVDKYVVYDNIEFTRKGWINRNRILVNGKDAYVTLPLKNDSDYKMVKERQLADSWVQEKNKLLSRISESYRKAPFFSSVFPLIQRIVLFPDDNLFEFIFFSIKEVSGFLDITTPIVVSSTLKVNHNLKSQDKVLSICQFLQADHYINPIGGKLLYDRDVFKKSGIDISFIKANTISYKQYENEFIPSLSIVDVLMFNSVDKIRKMLTDFSLE